jgi:metal-responsive CopG/Arc/MetJ family transcriptional regulator
MYMPTQTINISLPDELVKKIDVAAKSEYASRSDYIRQALVSKLQSDKVQQDDWALLAELSTEIASNAAKNGYSTDQDFVRAVKEVRRDNLSKASNK